MRLRSILMHTCGLKASVAVGNIGGPRRRRQYSSFTADNLAIARYKEKEDCERDGVVGILGATGTGKSKLSIDLGTRYPSEIVNSDKMQVYRGLDITTNKMPIVERKGVPHHLLGELDPSAGQLSPTQFRSLASDRIESIQSRRRLPVIAGGSNSFVLALLSENHDSDVDPFQAGGPRSRGCEKEDVFGLRYRCCLLWVDVSWGVLEEYLDRRVDEMVEMGMVEELKSHFDPSRATEERYEGLEMAIGVPEFDKFFLRYPPEPCNRGRIRSGEKEGHQKAIDEIKLNTKILARRQVEKIQMLRDVMGWNLRRLDATEAVRRKMEGSSKSRLEEAWERDVMYPAVEEVERLMGGRNWWWLPSETNLLRRNSSFVVKFWGNRRKNPKSFCSQN